MLNEHPPLPGQLHTHAGDAQFLYIIDGVYVCVPLPPDPVRVGYPSPAVDRVVVHVHHHQDGPVTGGQVLRRQIVEHIVRYAQRQQARLALLHSAVLPGVHRGPLHGVTPSQQIAAGTAQRQYGGEGAGHGPVADPHRRRTDAVARLVQLLGELPQATEGQDIHHNHSHPQEQARIAYHSQYAEDAIPHHQRRSAADMGGQPRLLLYRPESAPEAEALRQQQSQIGGGQHDRRRRGVKRPPQDGGVEHQQPVSIGRPHHCDAPAHSKPPVLPPQGTEAQ